MLGRVSPPTDRPGDAPPAVDPREAPGTVATAAKVDLAGLALGIDVGGTGVKAALVDLATAELASPRVRERTPQPSRPDAVIAAVARVVEQVLADREAPADLPVGCGLPGVIKDGVMRTAANLDRGWVDLPVAERIGSALGRRTHVVNDADAAGLAELAHGAARGQGGTVVLLTIGTGIGSAVISDGRLVPNTELGHIELRGRVAETLVSGAARQRRGLGWKRWARDFNRYLARVEFYLWPDLIVLGGGVSKEYERFARLLDTTAPIVQARFLNSSGIIGAAHLAAVTERQRSRDGQG
jgi:polyphosphate glucokinase